MGLFEKISQMLTSPESDYSYRLAVKCNRCGEIIHSRVDLRNDLSIDYNDNGKTTYNCRKILIGDSYCFQRVEVILKFDKNRNLIDRQIMGGTFVDEQVQSV